MLTLISKQLKGKVRITKDGKFVIWFIDNKNHIIEAIKIFDRYPPLTSRLTCCLSFLKSCLNNNDVLTYLAQRDLKYSNQNNLIQEKILKDYSVICFLLRIEVCNKNIYCFFLFCCNKYDCLNATHFLHNPIKYFF